MAVNKNYKGKVNCLPIPGGNGFHVPGICYLCSDTLKGDDLFICGACNRDLPMNIPACPGCALPVASNGMTCGMCLTTARRVTGDFFSPFLYTFPINRLIHNMKFHARIEIAWFLGRRMAQAAIASRLVLPQCFIPVPLHKSRVAERGYNQSLEIARAAASVLDIPVCNDLCCRIVNTPPQSSASAAERRRNLSGAFAAMKHCMLLPGHIAVVDDVITTGATVFEVAHVLRRNGVARTDVWAAARTITTGGHHAGR